jgi:hypothetical protein
MPSVLPSIVIEHDFIIGKDRISPGYGRLVQVICVVTANKRKSIQKKAFGLTADASFRKLAVNVIAE